MGDVELFRSWRNIEAEGAQGESGLEAHPKPAALAGALGKLGAHVPWVMHPRLPY